MNEEIERKYLINLIKISLNLNIENCKFCKKIYSGNKELVNTFNKSIRQSTKALDMVHNINHIEILRSIYGDIVGKMSGVLMLGGSYLVSKKLDYFDKTEKGFEEFSKMQEQAIKEQQEKAKQRQEYAETFKKAKENGEKVEFMLDPKDNKIKPITVRKEENA